MNARGPTEYVPTIKIDRVGPQTAYVAIINPSNGGGDRGITYSLLHDDEVLASVVLIGAGWWPNKAIMKSAFGDVGHVEDLIRWIERGGVQIIGQEERR